MGSKNEKLGQITMGEYRRILKGTPILNPHLNADQCEKIRWMMGVFAEVYPITLEEWELGFQKEPTIDREIDLWMTMGRLFLRLSDDTTSSAARKEIYQIIVTAATFAHGQIRRDYPEVLTHREFRTVEEAIWPDGGELAPYHRYPTIYQIDNSQGVR